MMIKTLALATLLLSAPASAADLDVLTALDTCDALGLTGVTIASGTNCLQISGEVYYEFYWGDYKNDLSIVGANALAYDDSFVEIDDNNGDQDWSSYVEAYLRATGTAPTDFGPAKAVIELGFYEDLGILDEDLDYYDEVFELENAYVSVGDITVLSAGLKDTLANLSDDEAFGWLPSILADNADGVAFDNDGWGSFDDHSHTIQVVQQISDGFNVGAAFEALEEGDPEEFQGNLVGVVSYASTAVSAHATVVAADVLDGHADKFALHSGITATLDAFKARAAFAANDEGWWNGLLSGEATLDLFTLFATVDANSEDEWSVALGGEVKATDLLALKTALRYIDSDTAIADDEGVEVRARAEYALLEKLTLSAEVGHVWVGESSVNGSQSIFDGLIEAGWEPDGGFSATAAIGANSLGAYKTSFTASRSFE